MKTLYYIVKIKCPVVTSACTIDGAAGYGTPISCTDQIGSQTTEIREYLFTDWNGPIVTSPYNNIKSVSETTPELKSGNGLASRSTLSITLTDFKGDPNEDSPAVVASPSIIDSGTFFGKLDERQILKNKEVEVEFWEYTFGNNQNSLIKSHTYYIDDFKKQAGRDEWSLTCKDLLYKSDDSKQKFPQEINESLVNDITDTSTTVTITNNANLAAQDWIDAGVCVVGKDVMLITNAVINGANIDLTVTRQGIINIGTTNQNSFRNTPVEAEAGENVFKGQLYEDTNISDVIADHLTISGITQFNVVDMQTEISSWVSNSTISTIFFESKGVNDSLNALCEIFVLDIFADVEQNEVRVLANSPWKNPVRSLSESIDFDYNKTGFNYRNDLRVSNAVIRYYKKDLSADDNEREFILASQGINTDLDGVLFFDESPTKKFDETAILGNSLQDTENATLTTSRHVQRFSNRPLQIDVKMSEAQLGTLKLGDVVTIESGFKQDFAGNPLSVRAQIVRISPKNGRAREYGIKLINYNPEIGTSAITISDNSDINLFLIAGAPPAGEYTFILDANQVGTGLSHAIRTGSFPAGSTVNIICENAANLQARGGNGGSGGDVEYSESFFGAGQSGSTGGTVFICDSAITVNIYLSGSRTVQGENYTCDGELFAPGGGGGGGAGFDGGSPIASGTGSGGGGGAGRPAGVGGSAGAWIGSGPNLGDDGANGTDLAGGLGGTAYNSGGNGGNHGLSGGTGTGAGGGAGSAGNAIVANGATVTIYGDSTGGVPNNTRFISGNGDTPLFVD